MVARRQTRKAAPEPAFEYTITQADQAAGGTIEQINERAIRRTLADRGITGAFISYGPDRITIVAGGRVIL